MIKKTILVMFVLALLLPGSSVLAQPKIAVVDFQEALQSVNDGKEVKRKLESLAKKKKEELENQQKDLQTLKDELEKQAPLMKDDVKRKKAMEFQEKLAVFQEAYLASQKELAAKESELGKPIIAKMVKIAEEIAKERGYDLILEKGGVVYAQSDMNLTDELIKRYNTKK